MKPIPTIFLLFILLLASSLFAGDAPTEPDVFWTITIDQCRFEQGTAVFGGLNGLSALEFESGREPSNAPGGNAGGIAIRVSQLDISRSSLVGCRSESFAGAIYARISSELRMASCTLAENESRQGSALRVANDAKAYLNHGTISGNIGPATSVDSSEAVAELHLRNTAVINNRPTPGSVVFLPDVPTWISGGNNVLDNADEGPTLASDIVGPFPSPFVLETPERYPAFFDNGRALSLLDRAAPSSADDPYLTTETDILGFPRIIGSAADIGSYENSSSLQIDIVGCRISPDRSGRDTLAIRYRSTEPDVPVRVFFARAMDGGGGLSTIMGGQTGAPAIYVQSNGTEDEVTLPTTWLLDPQEPLGFHALSVEPPPPLPDPSTFERP